MKHILIVPSEEFVPAASHITGIFQYHQALVLKQAGYKVGALSVRQDYSIPMILRAAAARVVGRRVGNPLDQKELSDMGRLLRDKVARPGAFIDHDTVGSIPVVRISGFYYLPPSPKTNFFGWVRAGKAAYRSYVAAHGKPDLIHAHNLDTAGLLAESLAADAGTPYVVTEHSTYFERGLVPRSLYPRLARAAKRAAALMVVSPTLGKLLRRELGIPEEMMTWVPNVIDPVIIDSPPHSRTVGGDFRFFSLGNLVPVKNHALLLRSFHAAFSESAGISLRIGGEGPLRTELESLAAELGISAQVSFLGSLERETVIAELDRSDAFVLPSTYETFGVVLIEALARGRPVIATACGGPEAFITAEDGELVPNGDEQRLAAAMRRMVFTRGAWRDDDLRRRAIARFGPAAFLEKLRPAYAAAGAA